VSKPTASVVITVFNAGNYLRVSLESILNQTYRDLDVWVVDDGSTDGCVEAVRDLNDSRVRWIRQANSGKPVALNRVLDQLDTEFYAVHDADDISHPRRIEKQIACLLKHPHLGGCFTGHELLLGERRIAPRFRFKDEQRCAEDIRTFGMPGHDPTVMYRRSLVGEVRYAADLPIVEGHDFILRVGERFPLMVLGECLYSYRIHPASLTHSDPSRRMALAEEVLRRACERRGIAPESVISPPMEGRRKLRPADIDNNIAAHLIESVIDLRNAGRLSEALRTAWFSSTLHPLDPHYHKALVYALLPAEKLRSLRKRLAGQAKEVAT
jgi:glycosyltransferase involved in cell wall biosynthesis